MPTAEEISVLKNKRSASKGAVTKVTAKGHAQMTDEENAPQVEQMLTTVDEGLRKFDEAHTRYHETLSESVDIEESQIYSDAVHQQAMDFKCSVEQWLGDIRDSVQPKDNSDSEVSDHELHLHDTSLNQRLLALETTKRLELEEFRLQKEIEHQRHVQTIELEMQRLRQEKEMQKVEFEREQNRLQADQKLLQASTPNRTSLGISSIGPDDSTVILADTIKTILEESKSQQQYIVDNLHAPKIDLIKFNGDPLKYWPFITSFENVVATKIHDDGTKLNNLIQSCTGEVNNLLQCCLVKAPTEGYKLARELLKERYGDDEVISQAWINCILDRPKVTDAKQLRAFADDLRTCKETLITMGGLQELETRSSLKVMVSKLSDGDQNRWLKMNCTIKEKEKRSIKLTDIIKFVDRLARERSDPVFGPTNTQQATKPSTQAGKPKDVGPKRTTYATNAEAAPERKAQYDIKCPKCRDSHYLNQCAAFRSMSVRDRLNFVQRSNLCVNCFKYGHKGKDCTRAWVCNVDGCGQKHNRWLHLTKAVDTSETTSSSTNGSRRDAPQSTTAAPDQTAKPEVITASTIVNQGRIALPIKPVLVKAANGEFVVAYALHDNCSNGSLCTDRLVEKLGLPTEALTATFTTINEKTEVRCKAVDLDLKSVTGESTCRMSGVLTRPSLNISINSLVARDELADWPHLQGLEIPNVDTNAVDILVGQDNAALLVPLETRAGRPGEPFAVRTMMGWGINGPMSKTQKSKHREYSNHFVDLGLEKQVEKFWKLDDPCGQTDPAYSINDKKVISEWEDSIERDGCHYSLSIPFKHRPPCLPNNYRMAEHRLKLLGKRLLRDADLRDKYTKSITEAIDKGYAEEVPEKELMRADGYVWYLPHHSVTHPRKPGKVRVVFDCAARCQGTSLNDRVHKGPDLTNKLIGVLLRFRQEPIAVMADIEGMFNQVRVTKDDRDALRFLWWQNNDPTQEPKVYRMATHLFGGVWSPSCANYALKKTAEDLSEKFNPETIKTVDKNFYVDDCLKSVATVEEAAGLVKQLCEMLILRGFRLTKFVSNSRDVLKTLPETERSKSLVDLDLDDECLPRERTLGVLWNVQDDNFTFDSSVAEAVPTKRGVLSMTSSIYDPLGFVSPFVLQAKRIFQSLCRQRLDWDEPMPQESLDQWTRWKGDLSAITEMKIPRCFKPKENFTEPVSAQLHHFSDASEQGLGAVSYLRLTYGDGSVHCSLVMAKSRLAPLKTTTIPRLELTAAVISVRLDKCIQEHLEIPLLETVYWTDSMIVLQYLRNEDKRFQTFVANRVAEIRRHTDPLQWKHVDSASNPADEVSRGMTAEELAGNERWILGPPFLRKSEEFWPKQPVHEELKLDPKAEIKKEPQIYHIEQAVMPVDVLLTAFSSWTKLKGAVGWLLRLKDRLRKLPIEAGEEGRLTVREVERSEKAILTYIQNRAFPSSQQLKSMSKLSPLVDEGVIRVGGRLANAPLAYSAQHPAILPKDHPVTELIIRHYHAICGHSGVERVLAEVRQRYWPLRGRTAVKRVVSKCLACRKRKAPTEYQQMANLPEDRVTPSDPPFSKVGVDYFGPILVKRGRSEHKRYGCLFTCLTTRAIHIEVAFSLDTDSFIQALQRFIARRGEPLEIRSDNGTNFVGARKELSDALQDWNREQIHNYLLQRHIKWIFNPPAASHMGGVWERQIRTIRSLILGLGGQQSLSDESLCTLMCNVEGIVNGRPLTKLSEDPTDPRPLTPNHLLLLRAGPSLPPGRFVLQDLYRRRWRQVQYLADVFWRRWLKEYLPCLQERQKWLPARRNLQPGDLVLMSSENTPRNQWPLGLIIQAYPGKDDLVRSVKVKTQSGVYDRPVTKLCLLEANIANQ